MPATLDLHTVLRFAGDLNARLQRCENGEGIECSSLDARINYYVQLCSELREYVNQWARAVFTGRIPFDPEVDKLLNEESKRLLHRAADTAARGRAMNGLCFVLQGLDALHYHLADFHFLLENWVSPRLAVSPAPRVKLPDAAKQQIRERLDKLPALPSDWRPTDARQLALFKKQRGE